ncbi:MAG: Calx-beta domain-containing protein [Pseudonocardiaceae bacterium]
MDVTLGPGASTTVAKQVTTPVVPPNPDVVLLADTTGSMFGAIADVRTNASTVTGEVLTPQPTAQFAVAEYRDTGDAFVFRVNQNLTADTTAVQNGINAWNADGGGDTPEAAINALFEIGSGAIAFRPNGTRVVAWFGDAPSHDPSEGHTLADAIAALQAASIQVVAVNVGPSGGGLDTNGQATAITSATGGVLLNNVPANDVSQAIINGIKAIQVTVTPVVTTCDPQLSITNSPDSITADSGSTVTFTETIAVNPTAAPGTYHCTVDYQVDGVSQGNVEQITVGVRGLSINDVSVTEGNSGTTPATFTVSLDQPSPTPVTVGYATTDGSATAPADYATTSGTVTFEPGQILKPVTVPVNSDTVDEPNETFTVTLSSASGATISDGTGLGTIVDDDRNGVFSCRASALNLAGIEPSVANPDTEPCKDDTNSVAQVNLNAGVLKVSATALPAKTSQTPDDLTSASPAAGDNATADSKVLKSTIKAPGLTIKVGVINANAVARCVPGGSGLVPEFVGSSSIASLEINGDAVVVGNEPLTIPLAIGTLRLNNTETTATSVTQRAVVLDTPHTDVVISEAHADVAGTPAQPSGNPCNA